VSVSVRPVGSTMPATEVLTGLDWSRTRAVNGVATVVNRPLSFPLDVGRTWSVSYTEHQPNRVHSSEHFSSPYRVIGWEDVTVPAGPFHAVKIECEGVWSAVTAPGITSAFGARVDAAGTVSVIEQDRTIPHAVSGRTYKAFWYVPGVKKWVKSVEEYYDGNGVRYERHADELQSYKVD